MVLLKHTKLSLTVFFILAVVVRISSSQSFAMLKDDISASVEPRNVQTGREKAVADVSKYTIQPGDIISITVEDYEDYSRTVVVQRNGKIKYMPMGEIQAAGLTASQLEENIAGGLRQYISDPQVEVTVERKEPPPEAPPEEIAKAEAAEVEPEVTPEAEKERVEKPDLEKKEYLISPGDVIDIVVRERADYNRTVVVQPDGKISYPPLGEIPAAGFTEDRLFQQIAAGLSSYTSNPRVKAAVRGRVEFFGKVEKYPIKSGDAIDITVEGRDNYNQTVVVQPNGRILYSPLGEIQAAGYSPSQLTDNISLGLSAHIGSPQVRVNVGQFKKIPEEIRRIEAEAPAPLKRFGYNFFTGARHRVLKLEESLAEATGETPTSSVIRDAISGFVGPVDMMSANVAATVPPKYVLGPGDRLTLHFWSDVEVMEFQTVSHLQYNP